MKTNEITPPVKKIDLDDGYFYIAQDIPRTLCKTTLSSTQRAIIDIILSRTYGIRDLKSTQEKRMKRRKTEAGITHKFFYTETGIKGNHISEDVKQLKKWNIIGHRREGNKHIYWFNPNVSEWDTKVFRPSVRDSSPIREASQQFPNQGRVVPQSGKGGFPNQGSKNGVEVSADKDLQTPKRTSLREPFKRTIINDWISEIQATWNVEAMKQGMRVIRKTLTEEEKRLLIEGFRNGAEKEDIIQAIQNYFELRKDRKKYEFLLIASSLGEFLKKEGVAKCIDLTEAKARFVSKHQRGKLREPSRTFRDGVVDL